jgi:myo-inositol-1-phosphate synthase
MSRKTEARTGARVDDGGRVAIVGVGNCANSLLQGREYYMTRTTSSCPAMHVNLGGYHIRDIEFTAAFDVVKARSARISPTRCGPPERHVKFADVPKTGINVFA